MDAPLTKGQLDERKKGKENEKDYKKNGKGHRQELERGQRNDGQDFGLQSLKKRRPPIKN